VANNPASPAVTPPEGKTTIDDKMFFGPERLSYQSAADIAQQICARVAPSVQGKLVVIAGTALLADFANLQAVYLTLESLERDYQSLAIHGQDVAKRRVAERLRSESFSTLLAPTAATGAIAGVAPVTAGLSAALGLVSLFREDVEYHGAKTSVDALAFELALGAKLKLSGAQKVFVPDLMVLPLTEDKKGMLRSLLERVQTAKGAAWASAGPLIAQLVRLEAALDQAALEKKQEAVNQLSADVSDLRRDMEPITVPLGRADQRLADLQAQWNQTDQTTGLSLLARLLRAEAIRNENACYVHAAVVSSGGHHRISHNLLRMIFLGDGLSFTGGAIARWALLGNDGSIEDGGIFTAQRTVGTLLGISDGVEIWPQDKRTARRIAGHKPTVSAQKKSVPPEEPRS